MKFYAREYEGRLDVFSVDGVYRIRIAQLCGVAKKGVRRYRPAMDE
ncbi:MAG TPA: hypothetical protein VMJ11_16130 [Paraburkholderia sp.]|nr:hypothetical protein [Paraburkholderia sp.]HTR08142.1 hypothetical protein [Paraburkholderia sp.]